MIHVYNIYSDSEICVVVLFRNYIDSWLPDGSSTLSLEVRLFLWLISRGKFKGDHVDSIVEQTVIPLVFEVRLSRNDPDVSP